MSKKSRFDNEFDDFVDIALKSVVVWAATGFVGGLLAGIAIALALQ